MKRIKLLFTVAMTLLGINNNTYAQKVSSSAYNVMLKTLLSHNVKEVDVYSIDSTEKIIFLDSREKDEYKVSHIKDAIWVGYDDFNMRRVKDIPKDSKIIVYCSVGKRSEDITAKLEKAGYKDVSNMYGGIFEWVNSERPVYKDDETTNQVHAYNKAWGVWVNKGEKVYKKSK